MRKRLFHHLAGVLFVSASMSMSALADDAPVVDLNNQNMQQPQPSASGGFTSSQQSLPLDQRVTLLEQQMNNFVQMNLPGKIDHLNQQIQQLNGQAESQAHEIQTLTDQLNAYKTMAANAVSTSTAAAKTASVNNVPVASTATTATAASATHTPVNTDNASAEQQAYQAAFNYLVNKQNDKAATAFQSFLSQYPSGKFSGNAHYWLGEIYTLQGKIKPASAEFNTLINKYPKNPKVADAMLKLAIIHDISGQHDKAKAELQKIVTQYPGSSAARLAAVRLQQIKQPAT